MYRTPVDHNTISQYTGLTDIKDVKIFTRDIIEATYPYGRLDTKTSNREVYFDWRGAGIIVDDVFLQLDVVTSIKVIGSIDKNPEIVLNVEPVVYHDYDCYKLDTIDGVQGYVIDGMHEEFDHNIRNVDVDEFIELVSWKGKHYRFKITNFESDGHGGIHTHDLKVEYEEVTGI